MHAVASEALDDAGDRACADGALVHNPTLADSQGIPDGQHL
ncbi:hypothetical protein BZL30_4581 [Mycobacterium kansasii]|uniref:Uncharacterized protein n=1 Tax=Mycobacterium kansasii TaxID=1768 RepID=A0A1V3WBT4_MYCKA|nr:hypothetical protein BZL29_8280 [Mycobacterium kansasii]OOK73362.1 hypothetical protein BZL30_4581 [Mycobacterium kansasii]